jgi:hypothetical protein
VLGTRTHSSTTGDTPLDMTVTRGNRPPPSYSQSLANNRNAPARPSVITCAPPASSSWGERSSGIKGSNKNENGRQGHRRELLSGEFICLYCTAVETKTGKHDSVCRRDGNSVLGIEYTLLQSSTVSNRIRKPLFFLFFIFSGVL